MHALNAPVCFIHARRALLGSLCLLFSVAAAADRLVDQASFSTANQSIWVPGPGTLEAGFKSDLIDINGAGSIGGILDAKVDLATATRQGDIQFLCPAGSFLDLESGNCYQCPAGFDQNPLLPASDPAICSNRSNETTATLIGEPTFLCENPGEIPDPATGSCYSCPVGYSYDPLESAAAGVIRCSREVRDAMNFQRNVGCAAGDFNDGSDCFDCPAGYVRDGLSNNCARTFFATADFQRSVGCDAGEFDANGRCYTCPAGYTRDGLSTSCVRTDVTTMQFQRTIGCPTGNEYLGSCYSCPSGYTYDGLLNNCYIPASTSYSSTNLVGSRTCTNYFLGVCTAYSYSGTTSGGEWVGDNYYKCPTGYNRTAFTAYNASNACEKITPQQNTAPTNLGSPNTCDTGALGTNREFLYGSSCYQCPYPYIGEAVPSGPSDPDACRLVSTVSATDAGAFQTCDLLATGTNREIEYSGACYQCPSNYLFEPVPASPFDSDVCSRVDIQAGTDVGDYQVCDLAGLGSEREIEYQGACYQCGAGYLADLVVTNPNDDVCSQVQATNGVEEGNIELLCPAGEFIDLVTHQCYTCGDQTHEPLLPADVAGVCYTFNTAPPADTGVPQFLCPLGTFTDVVTGGCYTCPTDYVWNPLVPVDQNGVCLNVIAGENLANPTFQAGIQADYDFDIRWGLSGRVVLDGGSATIEYMPEIAIDIERDLEYTGSGVHYVVRATQIADNSSLSMGTSAPGLTAELDTHLDATANLAADVAFPGISELGQLQQERFQFSVFNIDTQGEQTPNASAPLLGVGAGAAGIYLDLLGERILDQPLGVFSRAWTVPLPIAPPTPVDPASGGAVGVTANYTIAEMTLRAPDITTPVDDSCRNTSLGCLLNIDGNDVLAPADFFGDNAATSSLGVSNADTSVTNYLRAGSRTEAVVGGIDAGQRISDLLKLELDLDGLTTFVVEKATGVTVPLGVNFAVGIPLGDRQAGTGEGSSGSETASLELFSLSGDLIDLDLAVYLGIDVAFTFRPNLEVIYSFDSPVTVTVDGATQQNVSQITLPLGTAFDVYASTTVFVTTRYTLQNNQFESDTNLMLAPVVEGALIQGSWDFLGRPASFPRGFAAATFAAGLDAGNGAGPQLPPSLQLLDLNFFDDADKAVFSLGGFTDVDGSLLMLEADTDADGLFDFSDNCPGIGNADQADANGDGVGNACDYVNDADQDGLVDADEVAAGTKVLVADSDGDGIIDGLDPEPLNDQVPVTAQVPLPWPAQLVLILLLLGAGAAVKRRAR